MGTWRYVQASSDAVERPEPRHPPKTYWCDFRFTRRATSLRAVERRVSNLIEAAYDLGFEFDEAAHPLEKPPPFPS